MAEKSSPPKPSPPKPSPSSTKPWSLMGVFAPTVIALAGWRWGTEGFAKLDSLLTSTPSSPSQSQTSSSLTTTTSPNTNTSAPFSMAALRTQYAQGCPDHTFRTSMFSSDPIITYIEGYLSPDEIAYLLELAVPLYQQSPVSQGKRLKTYNAEIRSSMSAVLDNGRDPVVKCIEQRAVDFQGFMPRSHLEDLQVVKYGISDHFRPHFDWFGGDENPRISSFFVYIACDAGEDENASGECKGGATQFPDYVGRFPAKWCKFIDCHDESGVGGVAFKPIPGNAIFWGNLYPNGTGHPGTWHAGMPVTRGRKVGMNILTRRDKLV